MHLPILQGCQETFSFHQWCIKNCPHHAWERTKSNYPLFNSAKCENCYRCIHRCPAQPLSFSKYSTTQKLYRLQSKSEISYKMFYLKVIKILPHETIIFMHLCKIKLNEKNMRTNPMFFMQCFELATSLFQNTRSGRCNKIQERNINRKHHDVFNDSCCQQRKE